VDERVVSSDVVLTLRLKVNNMEDPRNYDMGAKLATLAYGKKVQVKFTLKQATKAQRRNRYITLLFLYPRR
jgi:hypothetical protein